MKYILNDRFRFRGWDHSATGILNAETGNAVFPRKEEYLFLLRCDGAHDLKEEELSEADRTVLQRALKEGLIRKAGFAEFLTPKQAYKTFPARRIDQVHWSITGACNLKCRHCFMSAPHAKHGAPTHEQIIAVADQLAECGIFHVGLTGGEPLIREDFTDILDALRERGIFVDVIFTNGWLVDEAFLAELDRRKMRPSFQLSFDGVGCHDFLRGVPGAEERAVRALTLLKERGTPVSVSTCIHRENRSSLRETVRLMASLGVRNMKCGSMMQLGEWTLPEVRDLQLTPEEELRMFEEYIPQYFEDDAPVSIMLSGAFMYTPGDPEWEIYYRRPVPEADEEIALACGVLGKNFYIGADGMVCPCMGMADCNYSSHFGSLFQTPLREFLAWDSDFSRLCRSTVRQVRDGSGKCRECRFADRCSGGCRNSALMAGDNYFGVDPSCCWFFEHDGEARVAAAAKDAFEAYLKRHPPREKERARTPEEEPCP